MTGKREAAIVLLEHGAQIFYDQESRDTLERSPFTAALGSDHPHMVKLFLDHCNNKLNTRIPLDLLYTKALQRRGQKCAVVVVHEGYFPHQKVEEVLMKPLKFKSSFEMAGRFGFIELMRTLIEVKPQFLQESWLVFPRFSIALIRYPDFIMWLLEQRRQPPSLIKLCKSTILAQLGTYYKSKIHHLPLPTAMKSYLESA